MGCNGGSMSGGCAGGVRWGCVMGVCKGGMCNEGVQGGVCNGEVRGGYNRGVQAGCATGRVPPCTPSRDPCGLCLGVPGQGLGWGGPQPQHPREGPPWISGVLTAGYGRTRVSTEGPPWWHPRWHPHCHRRQCGGGGHAVAQAPAHLAAHTMARVAAHCVAHVAAHAVARVAARLMAHALPPLPPRRGCPQTGVTPAGVPVPAPPAAPLQGWRRPACRAAAWMAVAARPSVHRALPVTHFSAPLRRGHRAAAPTPAPLSPPRPCTVSPTPGGCPRVSGAAGGHGEGAASVRSECAQ